jgi:thioredoxin 1
MDFEGGSMKPYRSLLASLLLVSALLLSMASSAWAGIWNYSEAEYHKALRDSKTIVLHFHADWCPTCTRQAPLLEKLSKDEAYKDFVFFKLNYDEEADAIQEHKVIQQSTVVVLKGKKEVGRSIGATSEEALKEILDKGK